MVNSNLLWSKAFGVQCPAGRTYWHSDRRALRKACCLMAVILCSVALPAQVFTFTAPSGQMLRGTVVGGVVEVSKQPGAAVSGPLVIPSTVSALGVTYRVERIGSFAATSVTSLTLPSSVRRLADEAFRGCPFLSQVSLGDSVRSIGRYAFYRCAALQGITLPPLLDSVGAYAFAECSLLADTLVIPDSTQVVGRNAFCQCRQLRVVCIGQRLRRIADECFAYCDSLTMLDLGTAVDTLGSGAFFGCYNLRSVQLPEGLLSLGSGCFESCTQLRTLTVPDSVQAIGAYAFSLCSSLESIQVGVGVAAIGRYAFDRCFNLDSFFFMSPIPPAIEANAFSNTAADKVFVVPCLAADAYSRAWGSGYQYAEPAPGVHLSVTTSDSLQGLAELLSGVRCDSSAVVLASPSRGYRFWQWSNGSVANPDTLQLTGDSVLSALFSPQVYRLHVEANNNQWGSVSGGGEYDYGSIVDIEAIANMGYRFIQWVDGCSDNPRQVAVESDTTFTALFAGLESVGGEEDDRSLRVFVEGAAGQRVIVIEGAEGFPVEVIDRLGRRIVALPRVSGRLAVPLKAVGLYLVRVGERTTAVVNQ